ncbi:hypothetical protein SDRG_04809 [Saprolegnia diclina VS20]|uniref:N-acetylglucosaminylphosphatidylinositol deacetylase n=1 Tax=Saprolegnia diclina (strain VS20) TaxID=1156394 RepID=T0RYU4_SAPDV|nr:hypothetical protein SDRG_04809 [Saprolegnia diclina VS20]EQC37783.1 hypothetical protein SDRG_04809 [Saprolegnia diclina VS20]|eukprot:XP_008608716.1 hypothetical protein SDRG_04809 [Saprolegnia diclina VS20]
MPARSSPLAQSAIYVRLGMRRFLLPLLLLAAAVSGQHNASMSSSVCTPIELDVDYSGNDIKATTRTNPEDCCADCAATPGCVVYVWNGASTCYLKHTIGWQGPAPGARAAKNPGPSSPFCSPVLENTEYLGVDMSWSLQRRAEDCCDDCRKTPGCQAFMWTPEDNGRCYLRRLVGDPTPRAGARSALVNKVAAVCTVEKDVDYFGNDIVSIPRDSADACCAECDATPNCVVYVWSTYTGRGVCNLKHTKGLTSVAPGAIAGSKGTTGTGSCSAPEPDVAYDGTQLATTSHVLSSACCQDCADTPGCTFYVWSSGVCSLRNNQGKKVSAPGSSSGSLRMPSTSPPPPQPPGPTKVQTQIFGEYPLPRIAYSVLPQARWLETSAYKAFLEAFERIMTNETLQAQHAGMPHELLLAASAHVRYFPRVRSAGECALVASTYGFSYFTFVAASQLCMAHTFAPSASAPATTWMRNQDGNFLQFAPQEFPTTLVRTVPAPTLGACQAACTDNCAGVGYTVESGVCAVVVPVAHVDADTDVVAGWVQNPHTWAETLNGFQYVTMTDRDVGDEIYKRVLATNIPSVVACAALVAAQADAAVNVLFLYDEPTQTCCTVPTTTSPLRSIQFVNYPTSPISIGRRVLRGLASTLVVPALSYDDCHRQCLPSASNCFASSYYTEKCTLYTALYRPRSTLGVLSPKASLPVAPPTRTSSALFLTAHQDDHELFVSGQVAKAVADPDTAVAFIYMTAGDAGSTNGWYEAREAGTLAATRVWVQAAGRFDPVQRTSFVTVLGHVITKVEIGNVAHYFLRLPEFGTIDLSKYGTPVSPMNRPQEVYATEADVQAVLLAIVKMEAKGRATLHSQQYGQVDHFLHAMTGRLIASAVATDPTLSTCLSIAYYWGYQKWLDPVNLPDKLTIELQRRAWLALSSTASRLYPSMSPWLDHVSVLGREYVASSLVRTNLCPA